MKAFLFQYPCFEFNFTILDPKTYLNNGGGDNVVHICQLGKKSFLKRKETKRMPSHFFLLLKLMLWEPADFSL